MSEEIKIESKNKINKKLLIGAAVIIAVALIAILVAFAPKTADATKIQEQLSLGEKYLSELKYEQAEAAYLAVIKIDPKNVDAYLGLADVYVAQGEYDKAISVLEDALSNLSGDAAVIITEKLEKLRAEKDGAEMPTLTPTSGSIGYDEEYWYETKIIGNMLRVDAENLKVVVEDGKTATITISGIEVQDSYVTNLATSRQYQAEYWWRVTMYSDAGVYAVDTVAWAFAPGENKIITIQDMQHSLWRVRNFAEDLIGDAEISYTADSITWTFAMEEKYHFADVTPNDFVDINSFDFANVTSYVVEFYDMDHSKISRVYNSKTSTPIVIETPVTNTPTPAIIKTEESTGKIFDSLKADPENLLSFDEIKLLDHSIVDLDIYTMQSLMEEKYYHGNSISSDDDGMFLSGSPGTAEGGVYAFCSLSASQDFTKNYVSHWSYTQYTHNNDEVKSPVEIRNIQMHDTLGEVLEKMGFSNAYEVEADTEYFCSEYYDFENYHDERTWNLLQWTTGLEMHCSCSGNSSTGDFSLCLSLSDTVFQEKNGNKRYSLELNFDQDENTNGKFILTDCSMFVH